MSKLGIPIALVALLSGCGFHATRYTWVGNEADLRQTHIACVRETQEEYVPWVAARSVMPTLYKDCMEKAGYLKVGSDQVPLEWNDKLWR